MNPTTNVKPAAIARSPALIELAPRLGPIERSSTTVSGAGSAPARNSTARSFASWTEKLPLICPWPPMIGSRMTGALITLPSSTMANGSPTWRVLTSAKRLAPMRSSPKWTTHSPVRESWPGAGFRQIRAVDLDVPANGNTLRAASSLGIGQQLGLGIGLRSFGSDEPERHLGSRAEKTLDAVGIGDTRQLDQDAVASLPGDHWLVDARLVDPAAHDRDRLPDRLGGQVGERGR